MKKNEELVTNLQGGTQSKLKARFELIPANALRLVAETLSEGCEKYGTVQPDGRKIDQNWAKIHIDEHLSHALSHLYNELGGDKSEDHLPHAICRLLFALSLKLNK